ncbi:MAG TPA: hypothetical protein VFH29_08080 [Anaerolineales bacterium]|nr:hypothetical protein [Anaerolineales bacterium]
MTLAAVHHILPLTTIVRERRLPIPGIVRVRAGQRVHAGDVVADAAWAREHIFIDVARLLGLSAAAADRLFRVKAGDSVVAGLVVARGGGLLPKTIRIPRAGKVLAAGAGQILMEAGESRLELRAGIAGMVREVITERGVVIETAGALVQGVWGNGRIDNGVLVSLADRPDAVLTANRIDISMRGSILMAGQIRDAETLRAATEFSVRGVLVGSIFPSLLPIALEARYPIVVTDGFGNLPMNSAAFRLLSTNNKREVTLNAESLDRYSGRRPEVIIPLPAETRPPEPQDIVAFAPGQTIRIRRQPATSLIGTIQSLPTGQSTFPSGLRTAGAEVRLENGQQLLVPLVNLEVVG